MLIRFPGGLRLVFWRIFHAHKRRFAQFALVGATGVIINNACLFLLVEACRLNPLVASFPATEVAILSNFVLNDRWTFRGADTSHTMLQRLLRYNLVALGGLAISFGVLAVLVTVLGLHYLLANVCAIGAALIWNYGINAVSTWATPGRATRKRAHTMPLVPTHDEPLPLDAVDGFTTTAQAS